MKPENLQELEKLAKTSYNAGLLPIFLGIIVVFVDFINKNYTHVLVGILIFIVGYAYVKISGKIKKIVESEK